MSYGTSLALTLLFFPKSLLNWSQFSSSLNCSMKKGLFFSLRRWVTLSCSANFSWNMGTVLDRTFYMPQKHNLFVFLHCYYNSWISVPYLFMFLSLLIVVVIFCKYIINLPQCLCLYKLMYFRRIIICFLKSSIIILFSSENVKLTSRTLKK